MLANPSNFSDTLEVLDRNVDALQLEVDKYYRTYREIESKLLIHPESEKAPDIVSDRAPHEDKLVSLQANLRERSQKLRDMFEKMKQEAQLDVSLLVRNQSHNSGGD